MRDVTVFIRSMRFLGTQIVSYPLLWQIRQFWPDCRLRVVAQDDVGRHYLSLPWVDEFVQANSFSENYRALGNRTDLMIALHFASDKYGAVGMARLPRVRLGFRNGRVTDFIWTHRHRKDFSEYMGLANMRLLSAYRPFDPEICARASMQALADLRDSTPDPADIVFMPGGGAGDYKRWPIESYVALADLLREKLGSSARFAFVLGPDESREHQWLSSLARPEFQLIMSRPIAEIAHLALGARLVVANDCGPSHLAQFACVPYVGIFHESNREWFWARPYTAEVFPADGSFEISRVDPADAFAACVRVLATGSPLCNGQDARPGHS